MFGKVKDPVCGMSVKKKEAAATSEHMGRTFYFCSSACKQSFDREPMKYMKGGSMEKGHSGGGCCH